MPSLFAHRFESYLWSHFIFVGVRNETLYLTLLT
jgi:hypothetical protein